MQVRYSSEQKTEILENLNPEQREFFDKLHKLTYADLFPDFTSKKEYKEAKAIRKEFKQTCKSIKEAGLEAFEMDFENFPDVRVLTFINSDSCEKFFDRWLQMYDEETSDAIYINHFSLISHYEKPMNDAFKDYVKTTMNIATSYLADLNGLEHEVLDGKSELVLDSRKDDYLPAGAIVMHDLCIGGIINHTGIYMGDFRVIHKLKEHKISYDSLNCFSEGKQIYYAVKKNGKAIKVKKAVKRAFPLIETYEKYDWLDKNCHNFTASMIKGWDANIVYLSELEGRIPEFDHWAKV